VAVGGPLLQRSTTLSVLGGRPKQWWLLLLLGSLLGRRKRWFLRSHHPPDNIARNANIPAGQAHTDEESPSIREVYCRRGGSGDTGGLDDTHMHPGKGDSSNLNKAILDV